VLYRDVAYTFHTTFQDGQNRPTALNMMVDEFMDSPAQIEAVPPIMIIEAMPGKHQEIPIFGSERLELFEGSDVGTEAEHGIGSGVFGGENAFDRIIKRLL